MPGWDIEQSRRGVCKPLVVTGHDLQVSWAPSVLPLLEMQGLGAGRQQICIAWEWGCRGAGWQP